MPKKYSFCREFYALHDHIKQNHDSFIFKNETASKREAYILKCGLFRFIF